MTFTPANSHGAGYPLGLTGATTATRYVGGTASGAPVSGTFEVGDFVITAAGTIFVCTVAGTPGTWVQAGGSSASRALTLDNTMESVLPISSGPIANVNRAHGWRVVVPKTGTLSAMYLLVLTSAGNIEVGILNAASGGTRTRLWTTGSIACPAIGWASLGNPALAVTEGQAFDFYVNSDSVANAFGRQGISGSSGFLGNSLPAGLFTGSDGPATRNYPGWQRATVEFPIASTVADTDLNGYIYSWSVAGIIT